MRINAIELRPAHVGHKIQVGVHVTEEIAELLAAKWATCVTVEGEILHVENGLRNLARSATRLVIEVWAVNGEIYPEFDRPTITVVLGSHQSPEVWADPIPADAPIIDRKSLRPGMTIAYTDSFHDGEKYVRCVVTAEIKSHPVSHPSGTVSVSFGESSAVAIESGRVIRTDIRGEGFGANQIIRVIPEEDSGFAESGSDAARFGQGSALVSESIMGDDSDEPHMHNRPSFIVPIEARFKAGVITRDTLMAHIDTVADIKSTRVVSLARR